MVRESKKAGDKTLEGQFREDNLGLPGVPLLVTSHTPELKLASAGGIAQACNKKKIILDLFYWALQVQGKYREGQPRD